ncbi:prolipoprotein diacylglyceryl transferase [archaeon]|nr:prolipoprotein diacylglyceryl transferase [archaeon]
MIPYLHLEGLGLGPVTIYPWGIMAAISIILGLVLISKEAEKRKCTKEHVYGLAFWIILSGLVASRLWHFLFYESSFNIIEFFRFQHGGFAFFGAIIGGTIATIAYIKYYKLNFWKYADLCAIYLPLAHFVARIGCLLTGEHIGTETNLPWAMQINGVQTHPVIIYEMLGLLIIFAVMLKLKHRQGLKKGTLFLSYVGMYSILRIIEDFFRSPLSEIKYYGLTGTQYGAVAVLILIICFWLYQYVKKK